MTRDEMLSLTNSILSDDIADEVFDALLDTTQEYIEGQRPWMILRKTDSSQVVLGGTSISTKYNLPSSFDRWYEDFPVQLVNAAAPQSVYPLREVPIARKFVEQFNPWKFFCDYSDNALYLCGAQIAGLTIFQFYIYTPPRISQKVGDTYPNEWVFPEKYHKIIPWLCAAFNKNGVDYDPLNAQQATEDEKIVLKMWDSMTKWDDELQNGSITGLDEPFPRNPATAGYGNMSGSGFVNINGY